MRFRIGLLICGLLLIGCLAFVVFERNQYNVVSHKELLIVREKLKILNLQERQDLAFVIGQVIMWDHYPYTLIGYKPMSICNVVVEDTEDLLDGCRESFKNPRKQMLKRGYLIWEKYQSFFPRKKHVLINYSFQGKGRREIALICSKLCMTTIEEHLDDFQEILGKSHTSEEVFKILTYPEHDDFYRIIDHTRLVGILLGFGRNNAYLYEQHQGGVSRSKTRHQWSREYPLQMFSNEWPLLGTWPWLGALLSPNFACDPTTEETQQLKKHYQKAHKIVRWTYFLRNSLEVTLALLTQS